MTFSINLELKNLLLNKMLSSMFDIGFDTFKEWLDFLKTQDKEEYKFEIAYLDLIVKGE